MILNTTNTLILVSTYFLLAVMHDAYRRLLEQFLAEEIAALRGSTDANTRKAFSQRITEMKKKERDIRIALNYCFPQSRGVVIGLVATLKWLSWPVSLAVSIGGYVAISGENIKRMELSDDSDIRIKTGG